MSFGVIFVTVIAVFSGLLLLGFSIEIALILAGISTATAPAAVVDVTAELNAKGEFTDTLLGIVAIDDAWGLLIFSFLLVIASIAIGNGTAISALVIGLWETFGAIALGLLLGFPMAYLTSHLYPGKSTQAEVLGLVLICAGIAEWLNVSYILSAMVMGMVVANFTKHHQHRALHEIQSFQWPLLILFFLLAGASLHLDALFEVGLLTFAYIVLRIIGRLLGARFGSTLSRTPNQNCTWMGAALLPQAGVSLGMALLAIHHFPELTHIILPVVLGSTVFFELIGPVLTRLSIIKAGEARLNHHNHKNKHQKSNKA